MLNNAKKSKKHDFPQESTSFGCQPRASWCQPALKSNTFWLVNLSFIACFCAGFLSFLFYLFCSVSDWKSCFSIKKMISTSERHAEHTFAGRNTQHRFFSSGFVQGNTQRKRSYIQSMVLQIHAFYNWDLELVQKNLPLNLQSQLLETLLCRLNFSQKSYNGIIHPLIGDFWGRVGICSFI